MNSLLYFLVLLLLGYVFGRLSESNHYKSIVTREKEFLALPTTSSKYPIGETGEITDSRLVYGSVVVSVDYYKRLLALLRNLFGGRVHAYETLLERARREATLRLKESCPTADQIINLRLETSSVYKGGKNAIGSVEVLAYGTAIFCKH